MISVAGVSVRFTTVVDGVFDSDTISIYDASVRITIVAGQAPAETTISVDGLVALACAIGELAFQGVPLFTREAIRWVARR